MSSRRRATGRLLSPAGWAGLMALAALAAAVVLGLMAAFRPH